MTKSEALDYLRKNPVFWSRLGYCYDPPLLDEAGNPLAMDLNFEEYLRTHDHFSHAGVNIHTCILPSGWVGVDRYDYTWCDRILEALFASGKTEYFIPRIKLNVPIDWCREYPEEVFVYGEGPRDRDSIRDLVGTDRQDYLGYEAPDGLYTAGAWKDPRPNLGGVIARQSFSSKIWLRDAGEALRRLVLHLEEIWGERILGYHIAYGTSGESMFWGRSDGKFGDYGIANQAAFRSWALARYGSEEAMEAAWGPDFRKEIIPPPEKRQLPPEQNGGFRDPRQDCWSLDYDRFSCDVNVDALEHFGRIVNENAPEKPVGAFYGYILHVGRSAYTGFLGWKRLLESPFVDFFAAPKSYFRCAPGEPGGVMAPTVTINRSRLWVDECDNRTHLAAGNDFGKASCLEETCTVLLRELCKNISHNSGLWYMDLGKGWFDEEGILTHISALMAASRKIRQLPYRSTARVAVILDEESILLAPPRNTGKLENVLREFQLTGTPLDILFSHDTADLSRITLAVLLTPQAMDDDQIHSLRTRLSEDARLLFCGSTTAHLHPSDLVLTDPDADAATLRSLLDSAGVPCYAPACCTVYADNRIVSFFPARDMTFVPQVPEGTILQDLLTGQHLPQGQPLSLKAKSGAAFVISE